jgi:DNA-binding transcriptional regulator YdaS (Cro superfamily)
MSSRDLALTKALMKVPSSLLARLIGITPQALSQWKKVPAARVLEVERITGVRRSELRPDLYPARSRPSTKIIDFHP